VPFEHIVIFITKYTNKEMQNYKILNFKQHKMFNYYNFISLTFAIRLVQGIIICTFGPGNFQQKFGKFSGPKFPTSQ